MLKVGYTLLIVGFIWVALLAVEANPIARASSSRRALNLPDQQNYTRRDVQRAYGESAFEVAGFATFSLLGGVLMLAGGIILGRVAKQSANPKPPAIPKGG